MPLNEIETHPYLDYFIRANGGEANVDWGKYSRLFIGSFPVYEITDTVFPEKKQEKRSKNPPDGYMPFFYGSKTNSFWQYLIGAFNGFENNGNVGTRDTGKLIEFCESNGILVSDIIKSTNRYKTEKKNGKYLVDDRSPNDSALFNLEAQNEIQSKFELNVDLVEWLEKLVNLKSIYFTAQGHKGKTPLGWFLRLLTENKIKFSTSFDRRSVAMLSVESPFKKRIQLFLLPTPSSLRTLSMTEDHRNPEFYAYMKRKYAAVLKEIESDRFKVDEEKKEKLKDIRREYLQQCWIEFVRNQNFHFLGSQ